MLKFAGRREIAFMALVTAIPVCCTYTPPATAFTNLEMLDYRACFDGVPLRERPSEFAQRMTTIPEGTLVKVDIRRGDWLRVIYKVPEGYFIGWSLSTMMCPVDRIPVSR